MVSLKAAFVIIAQMTTANNKVNAKENFLAAPDKFFKDQIILRLGSVEAQKNSSDRLQVDETHYILPPAMIYHSCDPNSYINWNNMTLNALRDISKGETITYHYGTSEYDYTVGAFQCDCGSKNCIGFFSGFLAMSPNQQLLIADYISPYIRSIMTR
jgi:hypothetical protein